MRTPILCTTGRVRHDSRRRSKRGTNQTKRRGMEIRHFGRDSLPFGTPNLGSCKATKKSTRNRFQIGAEKKIKPRRINRSQKSKNRRTGIYPKTRHRFSRNFRSSRETGICTNHRSHSSRTERKNLTAGCDDSIPQQRPRRRAVHGNSASTKQTAKINQKGIGQGLYHSRKAKKNALNVEKRQLCMQAAKSHIWAQAIGKTMVRKTQEKAKTRRIRTHKIGSLRVQSHKTRVITIVVVYVDDMLLISNNEDHVYEIKRGLKSEFKTSATLNTV